MLPENVKIFSITPEDLKDYVKLHKEIFKIDRDIPAGIAWNNWAYYKNPHGEGQGFCAKHENKLIGIYAVILIKVIVFDKSYIFHQVLSNAIHPQFRGKGIQQEMFNKTTNQIKTTTDELIMFGFPNKAALKIGQRHLDYGKPIYIRRYVKPLNFFALVYKPNQSFPVKALLYGLSTILNPLLKLHKWIYKPTTYNLKINRMTAPPSDIDSLWEEAKKKYNLIIARKKEHIQWRFFNEPGANNQFYEARLNNKLIGYFVLKLKDNFAEVVDFFSIKKEKIIESLFYSLMQTVVKQKAWWVRFRIHDDIIEQLLAENKFIVNQSWPIVRKAFEPLENPLANYILEAKNWYITDNSFGIG